MYASPTAQRVTVATRKVTFNKVAVVSMTTTAAAMTMTTMWRSAAQDARRANPAEMDISSGFVSENRVHNKMINYL